jgi:uncharacterized membrane protein YeaQ/YmgE (transglycosylase-associated protein family)
MFQISVREYLDLSICLISISKTWLNVKEKKEMLMLIYFVVIGVVIGLMVETFFKNQRGELGSMLSVIVGGIGGFIGGMLLSVFGIAIFGEGWGDLSPMFGAPIFALVLNLLVRVFKK